jgi:predicted DNA-binding transcriptional regulator AlpA
MNEAISSNAGLGAQAKKIAATNRLGKSAHADRTTRLTSPQEEFPHSGYVRLKQILQFIPVHPSTWWYWVKEGRVPKPIKLSRGVTVWKAEEIREMLGL